MNHPPATLFDQFLKERVYFKNVTPRTLIWYRVAFKSFRDSLAPGAPTLPTKATLQQFVVQLRESAAQAATDRQHGVTKRTIHRHLHALEEAGCALPNWR